MAEHGVLNVSVVSPERSLWSGPAKSLIAKTPEGEIGIMAGHEPILALLVEGPLRIEEPDGRKLLIAVHGGFFSVDSNKVSVLAEVAEMAEDIDVERAKAALERARAGANGEQDVSAIRRAETRITIAGIAKGVAIH